LPDEARQYAESEVTWFNEVTNISAKLMQIKNKGIYDKMM
jgi:hypothetical protein